METDMFISILAKKNMFKENNNTGLLQVGELWGHVPPSPFQILADQLTLSQLGGWGVHFAWYIT
jgi:hypothetical protein